MAHVSLHSVGFILLVAVQICFGTTVPLSVPGFPLFTPKNNGSFGNRWTYANHKFRVCTTFYGKTDGYIVSPLIKTSPAKEVNATVSYKIKDCSASDFGGANCKLFFELYISRISPYPADQNFVPNPMSVKFEYTGKLANSSILPDPSFFGEFTSSMPVDMKGNGGMYLALRDRGACGGVTYISVSYTNCPAAGGDLVKFNAVPAPSFSSKSLRVNGTCPDFSIPKTSAVDNYMKCFANGTAKTYGGCRCREGFEMASSTSCTACKPKTYKPNAGNIPCFKCAANVENGPLGNTVLCKCLPGYYRPIAKGNDYTADCEEPPSAPRNINATSIGPTWAFLRWVKPARQGTGDTVTYSVDSKQSVLLKTSSTTNLYFNLTGLHIYTAYNITVHTINNVTTATGKAVFSKMHFRTKTGLPGVIRNLKLKRNDDQSVLLSWEQPQDKGGPDLKYLVQVNDGKGVSMKAKNYTIRQEKETKKYFVSIKSYTSAGFSKAVTTEFTIQGKAQVVASGSNDKIIIGLITGIALLAVVIIILAVYIIKKNRKTPQSDSKKKDKQDTNRNDDTEMNYMDLDTEKMEQESKYATLGPTYEEIGEKNAAYANIEHN